jgi:8-oxo-dGTP diphosphatase
MLVEVVAAVIEQDGRYLLTRRQEGTHLSGHWEFPGGKIAPAESQADALRREIREELDASLEVGHLMLTTTFEYPARAVRLHFYRCALLEPPRAALGQEMRWVTPEDLRLLPLPPADAALIELLTGPNQ